MPRKLSKSDAKRNRNALLKMTAGETIEELQYWINWLNAQSTEELADLLYDVTRNMTYVCSEAPAF